MRKVVLTGFVSLDGVMEAPDQWHFPFFNDEAAKYTFDELFATDALLLGRRTYEGFAAVWPSMTDEGGFADRMNGLPKYVVSTTLEEPLAWNNSRLITTNVAESISKLKQQPGRDIVIHGSADLAHSLRQDNVIDEYRLMIHPVVVGHGKRLFSNEGDTTALNIVDTKTFRSGIVVLTYQPAGT